MSVALVTGGAGFIGSHVVEALLARGFETHVIDDLSTGKIENLDPRATLHRADIRSAETADVIRTIRPSIVAHLAAQIDVRKSVNDPALDAGINILGTLNILETIRNNRLPARVVFASSGGAIYGDFVTPPNVETFPKDPESPYAVSKLAVEFYLGYYGRVHGIESVTLRFANVFGPRQDPHGEAGVVAIFCGRLLQSQPLTVFGDGKQTRDYVYVGDVAEAVAVASTSKIPPAGRLDDRAFNIGTGVSTSVLQLVEQLQRAADVRVPTVHAAARPGEQMRSVVDITRAKDVLSWAPRVTLEDGLLRTYQFFKDKMQPVKRA